MGQAKNRGTFDQRREQSVLATQARIEEKRKQISSAWESMPEEEKERYRNRPNGTRMMDSVILAVALSGALIAGRRRK